jgi:hypothetical protein
MVGSPPENAMKHKLTVRSWNLERAKARLPMDVLKEHVVDGPALKYGKRGATGDVDAVLAACRAELARLYPGKRVRGLAAVAGGGFSATLEDR